MNNGRINLRDNFQFRRFARAMNTLNHNKLLLTQYDLDLYRKVRDGYNLAKRDLTLSVKQFNYLRQIADEIEGR